MNRRPEGPRVVRFANATRMAWKNGGGETAEIATYPSGAGLDAFGWRVSLATITADGPFSTFPGVDRTFAILDGVVALTLGPERPVRLDSAAEPVRFAGETVCRCNVLGSAATALNVMVRRGSFDCAVIRLGAAQVLPRIPDATILLICEDGQVAEDLGPLERHDVLIVPPDPTDDGGSGPVSGGTTAVCIWPPDSRPRPGGR